MKLNNETIKNSKIYILGRILLNSAPFALLLSLVLFWVEMYRSDKEGEEMISELRMIEQSLSTRFIGIFPDYLEQINEILETTESGDPIVVFEDVLYYGLFYNPEQFKEMITNMVDLSNIGHKVTIAYYGIDTRMFREVVQESRIDKEYLADLKNETRTILQEARSNGKQLSFQQADSIVSEKYFALTRKNDPKTFREGLELFRTKLYNDGDAKLFKTIDELRDEALGKPDDEITYADFSKMYKGISQAIVESLENSFNSNIEFIELNDYLVMSCWCNSKRILFALPGKFAAEEIGFISHDDAIHNYIETQLAGVRRSEKN